jgi:hypothetical protein
MKQNKISTIKLLLSISSKMKWIFVHIMQVICMPLGGKKKGKKKKKKTCWL